MDFYLILSILISYIEDVELKNGDQLWFVRDVDRWKDSQLRTIHEECEKRANWSMALSNPCFEVWLYLHLDNIENSTSKNCQELKAELPKKIPGGYNKKLFIPRIREAHRSQELDDDAMHFMPKHLQTKMHLLTTELFKIIGANAGL